MKFPLDDGHSGVWCIACVKSNHVPRYVANTPDIRHDNHLGSFNGIRIGEMISRRGMRGKRKKQKAKSKKKERKNTEHASKTECLNGLIKSSCTIKFMSYHPS